MNIKDVIKLGLWLLLVFALSENCYAETIKGSVKDVNGHPMPFVTISVLDKDSVLLTGDITDEQGKYEIEISNFKSQISNFEKSVLPDFQDHSFPRLQRNLDHGVGREVDGLLRTAVEQVGSYRLGLAFQS